MTKDQKAELAMEGRVESVFPADKMPRLFFHELIQSYNVAAIMDLTPGQGTLLEAAIDLRVPVVAFGITETHSEMLEDRLTNYCLQKLVDSAHTLYRPEAEQYLNGDGTWKDPKDEETTEASKKSKKVTTKAKKKRKQASEDSNAEEENEKEDEEEEEEKKPAKKPTKKKRKAKKNEESSEDEEW